MIIKGNSVGHPLPDPRKGLEMHGGINMNGHALKGLNAPVADDEAANKGYTDKEITDRVIYGKGKNLLKSEAQSQTVNGVTFTVNDDGSVTANGTASANAIFYYSNPILPSNTQMILSGAPGGNPNAFMQLLDTPNYSNNVEEIGNGVTFNTGPYTTFSLRIRIGTGVTASNLTFYPMIRLASEADDTYEPYYEGLKSLTDRGIELMWENASPTSAFAEQKVSLTLNADDYVVAEFIEQKGSSMTRQVVCAVGKNASPEFVYNDRKARTFTVSTSGVYFYTGRYSSTMTGNMTEVNDYAIPVRIFRLKGAFA